MFHTSPRSVSVLFLSAALFVAGCGSSYTPPSETSGTSNRISVTLAELLERQRTEMCTFEWDESGEPVRGVVYLDGYRDNLRVDVTRSGSKNSDATLIRRDGVSYIWDVREQEGRIVRGDVFVSFLMPEEGQGEAVDTRQHEFNCVSWLPRHASFQLPVGRIFISMQN